MCCNEYTNEQQCCMCIYVYICVYMCICVDNDWKREIKSITINLPKLIINFNHVNQIVIYWVNIFLSEYEFVIINNNLIFL